MEDESSQEPAIGPFSKLDESNPFSHTGFP